MANTITRVPDGDDVWGRHRVVTRDITFDGTVAYVNGTGYTINASDLGLKFITGIDIGGGSIGSGTLFPVFVVSTNAASGAGTLPTSVNIRLFSAVGTELASGTFTTFTQRLCAWGG